MNWPRNCPSFRSPSNVLCFLQIPNFLISYARSLSLNSVFSLISDVTFTFWYFFLIQPYWTVSGKTYTVFFWRECPTIVVILGWNSGIKSFTKNSLNSFFPLSDPVFASVIVLSTILYIWSLSFLKTWNLLHECSFLFLLCAVYHSLNKYLLRIYYLNWESTTLKLLFCVILPWNKNIAGIIILQTGKQRLIEISHV